MEALDREEKINYLQLPNYGAWAIVIFCLQVITWIFNIQHWPFCIAMKFFLFPLALGFFVHWFIRFRLSYMQKVLGALALPGSALVLAGLVNRILKGAFIPQGYYYFLLIAISTFIVFSLYTNHVRKKIAA